MSYVEGALQGDERVLYRARLSWTLYLPALLLLVLAGGTLALGASANSNELQLIGLVVAAVLALVGLASAARAWFRRWTTEIAVTDRRVILKRGFVRRHTIEMNMAKVESVDVDQTLLGRLFNYGSVTIRGTGSTLEPIRMIDHPLRFRTAVTAG